ncbi:1-acyl-sn-glycerol-3-phosphate acyltransferase alpha [Nilaparvata lugens]|uniref:1-acyl-sn-glycerol-3-phosphate acyltransferase alpha n=1 Tax=Nilaparvata lugens TaxID=108931 RepID=UPI00193D6527|nr:1-acyl-sn-glycerol-3-phosphate acyltransferase alpha [Nilaparvata lugens]XP_039288689.1 1-acyl-sn-glycerol-3-phosphate acyltransferase alpha [Nilaparvata lugens]XP_039288690.1 1-acyl-sn-glycerol-3-phosphate acyltransferase alpha [Nilaparvata lugens]XP_039288691.1 1-acyl-sn-glycerol-3-phosphate acyltransferase alpha [Nilaparvata lugens]XP_039288692.1 1-acyl-sn-glycerol-3-phosphate acyltransferase alpha [Nilaparvata lugens]XP_039288693.1 1-acyl-sn-glycerol-3-phosphate acyltransferase alpha [N
MFELLMMRNDIFLTTWPWHVHLVLIILVLRVLKTSTLKYYFAYIVYVGVSMFLGFFYMFIFMLRPRDPSNITLTSPAASLVSRWIGIEWVLRGSEHLAAAEAGVLVANHQSIFDALGIMSIGTSLKRAITIARKEVFYFVPFGISAWLGGVFFINRHDRKTSFQTLLETGTLSKQNQTKLIIFPEGTRNRRRGKSLLPFKTGAFRVAITNQLPIYPVVFSNYYFLDGERRSFHDGQVIIEALPPISTKGLTLEDMDFLLQKTWTIMQDKYKLLQQEVTTRDKEDRL